MTYNYRTKEITFVTIQKTRLMRTPTNTPLSPSLCVCIYIHTHNYEQQTNPITCYTQLQIYEKRTSPKKEAYVKTYLKYKKTS